MKIRMLLVPLSTAIAVASLTGVAISATEGSPPQDATAEPRRDPTARLDVPYTPTGSVAALPVPDGGDRWGPTPRAGDFPVSLADGCTVVGRSPSQLDDAGQRDLSKIPRWVRVAGQDAAGVPGTRGCIARELIYPMFDRGAGYNRLARQAGVTAPPLPVFWPDGTLTGYVVGRFRLVEQAIGEGSVPAAFLERPPVPQDIEPNA